MERNQVTIVYLDRLLRDAIKDASGVSLLQNSASSAIPVVHTEKTDDRTVRQPRLINAGDGIGYAHPGCPVTHSGGQCATGISIGGKGRRLLMTHMNPPNALFVEPRIY
ncbi:MAG TPA: hypothetical protein VJL08_02390 [Dehalococcoidia bacterium]|nr:hypothetical protein [Dehalococcoidia bacterium]